MEPTISTETPHDHVLAVDTEYAPDGTLLTIGIANRTDVRVWDVSDGTGGLG